jgi:hypothetical protein
LGPGLYSFSDDPEETTSATPLWCPTSVLNRPVYIGRVCRLGLSPALHPVFRIFTSFEGFFFLLRHPTLRFFAPCSQNSATKRPSTSKNCFGYRRMPKLPRGSPTIRTRWETRGDTRRGAWSASGTATRRRTDTRPETSPRQGHASHFGSRHCRRERRP